MLATPLKIAAALVVVLTPSVAFAEVGTWTVRRGADKWTDEEYVTALVHTRDHSAAVVSCKGGQITAQVRIGRHDWSPHEMREVRWRVDRGIPHDQEWQQAIEDAGVVVSGSLALEFANLVARANTRLVFMNSTGTRTFKLNGNWAAIGAVLLACEGKD